MFEPLVPPPKGLHGRPLPALLAAVGVGVGFSFLLDWTHPTGPDFLALLGVVLAVAEYGRAQIRE